MIPTIHTLVFLLAVIAGVAIVAARSKIPPSILLVVTGVVLALIPGLPTIEIAPEFVLLVVLPPIIYSSAVAMSWREFRFNLRPISLLAVGCVLFTTAATAAATHYLLGLAWPVGFVLGAIVSPPDAVAPLAIARRLRVPRRLLVILEGEGLANDATALVLYRFAVAAVSVGVFSFEQAVAIVRRHRRGRNPMGDRRRLVDAAAAALGRRSAHRNHAFGPDAVPRLLAAAADRRVRSARDRHGGALHQLERASADQRRDASARHILLGFPQLSDRGHDLPHHRPAGAFRDCGHPRLFPVRIGDIRRARQRRRHRRALRVDVSGDLSAALAGSGDQAQGSLAALAMAVRAGVRGRARRRLAGGGAGDPASRPTPASRFPTAISSSF